MVNWNKALDLVYPENLYCSCCGDTMQQNRIYGICDTCAEKMVWFTGNPFRSQMEDFAFSEVLPCCYYGFMARRIVSRMKLSGTSYSAKGIGLLLAERLKQELARPEYQPDALLAVPMHKEKRRMRGFNQTELLAGAISSETGIPFWQDAVRKTKATQSMRMSDAVTRRQALEDAMQVNPAFTELVRGRHLIVVDDVVTTGSTVDALSRVLLSAGAKQVDVLCFAITPNLHWNGEEDGEAAPLEFSAFHDLSQ